MDSVRLYLRSQFGDNRHYQSIPFSTIKDRVRTAKFSQNFEAIKYLLIATCWADEHGVDRFYPVPLLLDNKAELPYFAVDAALRLTQALEGYDYSFLL